MKPLPLPLLVLLVVSTGPVTAGPPEPVKEADHFVGTYVTIPEREGEAARRLKITREGEHYRLDDVTPGQKLRSYYPDYKFVRRSPNQLEDERGILGTLTLGRVAFDDKSSAPALLRLSFCYEQFLLVKLR